jgi:adenosylcobinamide-GDP ribazoletransferase
MRNAFRGFILAVQFLTRLPVPVEASWNAVSSRWAVRMYPLTGMLIGVLPALFVWLQLPVSLFMQSVIIVTFFVWMSGGLHLDGWMDTFDAVGANVSLEKKWEIMKDPHVGSFGILALVFLLGWKTLLIYELLSSGVSPWFFLLIPAAARWTAVYLLTEVPAAKPQGLAWSWQQHVTKKDLGLSLLPVLLLLPAAGTALFLWTAVFTVMFVIFYRSWILRHFHGVSGDLAGASIEGGELWGLAAAWIFISFVTV